VRTRDWNPFPWSQAAKEDFSGVAPSERRFFTHDENFKKCMMDWGREISFLFAELDINRR
jgi:hypothetical protein